MANDTDKEEFYLAVAPLVLEDALKLGKDINLCTERATSAWLITGSVDGCPVVGYVRGAEHALWFADSIV